MSNYPQQLPYNINNSIIDILEADVGSEPTIFWDPLIQTSTKTARVIQLLLSTRRACTSGMNPGFCLALLQSDNRFSCE